MFVIGLEFNLPKLRSMRTLVFGLGLRQVTLTIGASPAGNVLLAWLFTLAAPGLGARLAERGGARRGAGDEQHGHRRQADGRAARTRSPNTASRVMGVLLFQDLAVVPLLVLIPALGSSPEVLMQSLAFAGC